MAITAGTLVTMLSKRFAAPEWAFLSQVRNGTGWTRNRVRTADAMAMGLWPSRGMEIHGIEIKVDRGDWLRELRDPQKAEDMAAFCDKWWLAVSDAEIVQPGELPATWGLFAIAGSKLVCKKEAEKLTAKPIDRVFLGSILRKFREGMTPTASIQAELDAAHARGQEDGKSTENYESKRAKQELSELRKIVSDFETASGIRLDKHSYDLGNIAKAVRALKDATQSREHLARCGDGLNGSINIVRSLLANLEEVAKELGNLPISLADREGSV